MAQTLPNWILILLGCIPGLYGLFTIAVGFQEILAGRLGGPSAIMQGIVLVVVSIMLVVGFRTNLWLAWISWILFLVASLVFVFGVGPLMYPVVGLILLALIYVTWLNRKQATLNDHQ